MHTFAQKPKATQQITAAKTRITAKAHPGQNSEADSVLHLQRTSRPLSHFERHFFESRSGVDFSAVRIQANRRGAENPRWHSLAMHTRGRHPISTAHPSPHGSHDTWERQADRVADHLLRMPEMGTPVTSTTTAPDRGAAAQNSDIAALGGGEPLTATKRGYFEPRFGVDFGTVRLHRDGSAAMLAERYGARAFTFGRDVVLGRRSGDLNSGSGRALLAHELAHVVQQMGGSPIVQREEEPWSISPDPTVDERVNALVDAFQARMARQDAEGLLRIQQMFESIWRGRDLASLPGASKRRPAFSKEAMLTEGLTGRMVKQAGEDLTHILAPIGIFLKIWENEQEAKKKLAELPKEGVNAALVELYESLPGLHTPAPGPKALADLGTELTAVESFPFPLSIKPEFEFEIPGIPDKHPHKTEPRLWVGPAKVFTPGQEIHVRVTAEQSSWIYLVAPKDPKAYFQTGDDLLAAAPKLLAYPARDSDFFFAAPKDPGSYQVQLVSREQEILARQEIFVPLAPYRS